MSMSFAALAVIGLVVLLVGYLAFKVVVHFFEPRDDE